MTKILTKTETLLALADGKGIRCSDWPKGQHIKMTKDGLQTERGHQYTTTFIDEYELYEEPTQERLATTLEEALKARKIRIEGKDWYSGVPRYLERMTDRWGRDSLLDITLGVSLPGTRVVIEA